MKVIGVIGCGVVGGALAQCFMKARRKVVVYDKFKEIGSMADVVAYSDLAFVSVPTATAEDGSQEMSPLLDVLERLTMLKYRNPVIIKCTVVPGTMDMLAQMYPELTLVHNPEFLTEAKAVQDFMNQEFILLSGRKMEILDDVREVFKSALPNARAQMFLDYKTTELAKYIHNCFLATKVGFMNEMFNYAQSLSTRYDDAIQAALTQGVIGESHTRVPGPDGRRGFGGMCFPKDTFALLHTAPEILTILKAVVVANCIQRGIKGNVDA